MKRRLIIALIMTSLVLTACKNNDLMEEFQETKSIENTGDIESANSEDTTTQTESDLNLADMFSNNDKVSEYTETECTIIDLSVQTGAVTISSEGSYILRGTLSQGNIIIDSDKKDKIRLILDNITVESENTAAIYVKKADKVFVTLAPDSVNTLKATGEFEADGDNKIDSVVFSKSDLTFNGEGGLVVQTQCGNAITSKDDLVFISGDYKLEASKHAIEGKDSVRILDGDYDITAGEDGIHSGDEEDLTVGFTYIEGGRIRMNVEDDGIHSETQVIIAGGYVDILKSCEGIEGLTIDIMEGEVNIVASDDGMNATDGSSSQFEMGGGRGKEAFFGAAGGEMPDMGNTPQMPQNQEANSSIYIKISGGKVNIMASGDGVDSNGSLYVTGGEVYITSTKNSANGTLDYNGEGIISGGKVIAVGYGAMPQNFSNGSTQGAIMINTDKIQEEGSTISLSGEDGTEIISYTSLHDYNNVIISCPEIKTGKKYIVNSGNESHNITMESLIYGQINGMGQMGGRGHFGFDRDKKNSSMGENDEKK